jgi:hypothetical protein
MVSGSFEDLALSGPVTVPAQSRFVRIARQRIVGDVIIETQASHVVIEDCYIVGRVIVAGGAFHCSLDNLWVDDAPGHGVMIGDGAGMAGCGNSTRHVHVRRALGWGFLIQNQQAFLLDASSADVSGSGGMLAVSAHGTYLSPSAESNPIGMSFFDCRGTVIGMNLLDNAEPYRNGGASLIRVLD